MWCKFLILKTNYFWSNRGIVCLIISVLGPTQTQNILHEKKIWSDKIKKFFVKISKMVLNFFLNHLVKTYSFAPYKTWTVNPAVISLSYFYFYYGNFWYPWMEHLAGRYWIHISSVFECLIYSILKLSVLLSYK